MEYRAAKGTRDMLPAVAQAWEFMQSTAAEVFSRYGYRPIYTPMFEHTEVFARGIGEATDIVGKEMYTFFDKSTPPHSLTLRPEGTAGVVRAALENQITANTQAAKLYYSGPMFRYEEPQKGRMRQFWQIGAEALGMPEPTADAEVIAMLVEFFSAVGVARDSMRLLLNSMGDENCRPAYRDEVAEFIRTRSGDLCEECGRRADTNPLRAFDCKKERCRATMGQAPLLKDRLCPECSDHYATVKRLLDDLGIVYVEDPKLVRGLDYYTRTVFEVQADAGLGSQNAIGGGGRYDKLFEAYGGKPTPGLGFALGFERTLMVLEATGSSPGSRPAADVFVARVDASVADEVFAVATELRAAGIRTELDHQARSLKSQFKNADRLGARVVIVCGPDEIAEGQVTLRRMDAGEERRVDRADVADAVRASME